MPRIHFVRHGKASAGFSEDRDPGLNEAGRVQAELVAQRLVRFAPIDLITSPLRRARKTPAYTDPLRWSVWRWGNPCSILP